MKQLLATTFLTFLLVCVNAQEVQLPNYRMGQYYSDTIYSYLGDLPTKGTGDIFLYEPIANGFLIDGVRLIIVFDSVSYPEHALVDDGDGRVRLYQGDVKSLPISMEVYRGVIGFHIIAQGTPETGSQPYPCGLSFGFTLGDTFGMGILATDEGKCFVDPVNALNKSTSSKDELSIYPNPITKLSAIDFSTVTGTRFELECFNVHGECVLKAEAAKADLILARSQFTSGLYFISLVNEVGTTWGGKFVVE